MKKILIELVNNSSRKCNGDLKIWQLLYIKGNNPKIAEVSFAKTYICSIIDFKKEKYTEFYQYFFLHVLRQNSVKRCINFDNLVVKKLFSLEPTKSHSAGL